MYTLSKNIRLSAIIFMVVGAVLFTVDYLNIPKTVEEVAAMEAAHGDGHGGDHDAAGDHGTTHDTKAMYH